MLWLKILPRGNPVVVWSGPDIFIFLRTFRGCKAQEKDPDTSVLTFKYLILILHVEKKSTLKDYTSAKTGKLCPPGLRKGDLTAAVDTGDMSVSTWPVTRLREVMGTWLHKLALFLAEWGHSSFSLKRFFIVTFFKNFHAGILWVINIMVLAKTHCTRIPTEVCSHHVHYVSARFLQWE